MTRSNLNSDDIFCIVTKVFESIFLILLVRAGTVFKRQILTSKDSFKDGPRAERVKNTDTGFDSL